MNMMKISPGETAAGEEEENKEIQFQPKKPESFTSLPCRKKTARLKKNIKRKKTTLFRTLSLLALQPNPTRRFLHYLFFFCFASHAK